MAGLDWINLAEDGNKWHALVETVMPVRVPLHAGNFLTNYGTVSFSRRTLVHGIGAFMSVVGLLK
jgi:hypothetical protein